MPTAGKPVGRNDKNHDLKLSFPQGLGGNPGKNNGLPTKKLGSDKNEIATPR